ncbi:hypothetical protein Sjap_004436 [Stephania japonica]|uniref:Ubiquitin carboxyl-terminal hydrolase n=1 Tax=Stephania japonica TaxID=461633 RepID=A0AAP0PH07_9MAGN
MESFELPQKTLEGPASTNSLFFGVDEPPLKDMVGAGLVNLGNTCFLNAVLQCFTHTVPIVESLRCSDHAAPCDRGVEGFCLLCALREHVGLVLSFPGRCFAPYKLVDNLSHISPFFRQYEQEDAHEFLQCLLDKLDSSCSVVGPNEQNSPQQDSFVKKIFGGRLRSQLRCCNCGHCSNTFEPLIDLSLEIEDVDTLPNALKSFTKDEKIEETRFKCEECKDDAFVEKKFTVAEAPSVATFHLKRFKNDGSYVEKIDKYVEYPLTLDLQPFSSNEEPSNVTLMYELYAVVVHTGYFPNSGHYFCFIRSAPETWHRFDDSRVTMVSEEFVLSQEAYILFYAKQDTPWFASYMEVRKQCADINRVSTSPKSVLDNIETADTGFQNGASVRDDDGFQNGASGSGDIGFRNGASVSGSIPDADDDAEEIPIPNRVNDCSEKLLNADTDCAVSPPLTPTRSPSPDIFSKAPPSVGHLIPCNHLKEKQNLKRPADREVDDSKRKEALRLMKGMPSARAMKLRAYVLASGSHSEPTLNRKKHKHGFSYNGESSRRLSWGY